MNSEMTKLQGLVKNLLHKKTPDEFLQDAENSDLKKTLTVFDLIVLGISAVIGTLLPGKGAIYLHQDMDFKKPVYYDEVITAKVTIERINEEKHIYYLKTQCFNNQGEIKIDGNAIIKYKEE